MTEPWMRKDLIVSALLGGVVSGLVVWGLLGRGATASSARADSDALEAPDDSHVEPESEGPGREARAPAERVAELETEVKRMQKSIARQAKVDAVATVDPDADQDSGERITLSAEDPKFKNAVRAVVERAEQEKRDERQERRVARQLEALTEKLDLSDAQSDKLEEALLAQSDRFREIREGDKRPTSRKEWRETMTKLQAETEKSLGEFLDDDQLKSYREHQAEQWGRRGR